MKKKICVVFSSKPEIGGGFQYSHSIWEALKALDSTQWQIAPICTSNEWAKFIASEGFGGAWSEETTAGQLARRFFKRIPGGIALWRRLGRFVSRPMRDLSIEKPALAIFPCESYLSYGTSIPTLAPIHDLMYIYERRFPEVGAPAKFSQRQFVDRNVCRYSQGILVDSDFGKRQLVDSYDVARESIYVLPYVAPPYIDAGSAAPRELPFEKFIFYPAQLWEHKNHVGLLNALVLLRAKGVIVNLVLCGSKQNAATTVFDAIADMRLQNQVAYLGYVPAREMPLLYEAAVALVMPTFFGPTNIPPLEAFSRGCPVAVSDVYGMREQVKDAALLFDPNSVPQIAMAVERLWTEPDLRKELIVRGRHLASSNSQIIFNARFESILKRCSSDP